MDTEIKTLAQIKAMSGRNLDSSVNDSTLVSGETSAGTFGVFKFFQGIKNFFKNAQALATLTATSRITVTDADGNVTYTTPNAIKSTLGLATTTDLNSYQPIVTNVINGNSEWDTGIYINKSIQNTNNYKYKKTHLVMLSAINGYGDTISSRLVLISIGRSGNFITTTTVVEKSASASAAWLNNVQFIPSNDTFETNDNNTLIIKNNNTVSAYSVEVRFL